MFYDIHSHAIIDKYPAVNRPIRRQEVINIEGEQIWKMNSSDTFWGKMAASDWDEIKRLAADFQRAQLSSTAHKLSERNCIEVVNKLIGLGK